MSEHRRILEWGYGDLFDQIDWDFIHMRDHYNAIQKMGVTYEGMPQSDVIHFKTQSESRPGHRHDVFIQLADLAEQLQNPENTNIGDAVRQAMSGDLLVHCGCEAFLYYYQWVLLDKDAALMPIAQGNPATKFDGDDVRAHPPNITNPQRKGSVCKHLGNVLKVFPFWWNTIAGELQRAGYDVAPSTVEVPVEPQQPAAAQQLRQPQPGRMVPAQQRTAAVPQTFPELTDIAAEQPEQPRQQPTRKKAKKKKAKRPKRKKARRPRQPRRGAERATFPEIEGSFESMVNKLLGLTG